MFVEDLGAIGGRIAPENAVSQPDVRVGSFIVYGPSNVGLVGGGGGAFIVHPHQRAIHMDGTRKVVAAALHPDPEIATKEAQNWPYPIRPKFGLGLVWPAGQ